MLQLRMLKNDFSLNFGQAQVVFFFQFFSFFLKRKNMKPPMSRKSNLDLEATTYMHNHAISIIILPSCNLHNHFTIVHAYFQQIS